MKMDIDMNSDPYGNAGQRLTEIRESKGLSIEMISKSVPFLDFCMYRDMEFESETVFQYGVCDLFYLFRAMDTTPGEVFQDYACGSRAVGSPFQLSRELKLWADKRDMEVACREAQYDEWEWDMNIPIKYPQHLVAMPLDLVMQTCLCVDWDWVGTVQTWFAQWNLGKGCVEGNTASDAIYLILLPCKMRCKIKDIIVSKNLRYAAYVSGWGHIFAVTVQQSREIMRILRGCVNGNEFQGEIADELRHAQAAFDI